MSVDNIVKYINETPGNTNPSVVKSMVEAEVRNILPTITFNEPLLRSNESDNSNYHLLFTEEQVDILKSINGPIICNFYILEDNSQEEGGEYFKTNFSVLLSKISNFSYSDPNEPDNAFIYSGNIFTLEGVVIVIIYCQGDYAGLSVSNLNI